MQFVLAARNHYPEDAVSGHSRHRQMEAGAPPVARAAPLFFAIDGRVADAAGEHDRRFAPEHGARTGAGFLVTLAGGQVLTDGFLVADREGHLLSDSFRAHGMLARYGFQEVASRRLEAAPPASVAHRPRAAVLGIQTNYNYFHWLFEALPRIELLRAAGLLDGIDMLVPAMRPWMAEMAMLAGGADMRFVIHETDMTEVDELVVPARGLVNIQTFTRHALATVATLRERADARPRAGRRLFVSRDRAPSRRIAGEEALIALAARHGFERIFPEQLTIAEQIATFREAEAVAGPLGAGLANAAFMPPGAALIEFAPEQRVGDATLFANMAHHRGLGYAGIVGPLADAPLTPVDRRDFDVDLDLAARAFAAV
jgi:capsular polysaccharide biosynthesis protein